MNKLLRSHIAGGLIVALAVCMFAVSACAFEGSRNSVRGSGSVATEERSVGGITGVSLETLGDLTVEVGNLESLRVEAEDNLLQYLKTTVRGGVLVIEQEPSVNLRPKKSVRYYLTIKGLESVDASSSGSVTAPALRAGHFAVNISSSGNVHLAALEADSLEVTLTSSGNLKIGGGQVGTQQVRLSSSGDYGAGDLRSGSATVDVSSSGNATIWVTDRLDGRLEQLWERQVLRQPPSRREHVQFRRGRGFGRKVVVCAVTSTRE